MRQRCFIQRIETIVIAFEWEMMGRKVKRGEERGRIIPRSG